MNNNMLSISPSSSQTMGFTSPKPPLGAVVVVVEGVEVVVVDVVAVVPPPPVVNLIHNREEIGLP